jgi:hypothetical protein
MVLEGEVHGLDALVGVPRAHVELYIRQLVDRGLMESSVVTTMQRRPRVLASPMRRTAAR